MNSKISVLVPFGAAPDVAGQQRAMVFRWVQRRWDELRTQGLVDEIIIGVDPLFGKRVYQNDDPVIRPNQPQPRNAFDTIPFSVSRALNDAAKHARGDRFLLFGADHVPDPAVVVWAIAQMKAHPWARLHDHVLYADEKLTASILADSFGKGQFYPHHAGWSRHNAPCPGVLGLTRAAFESAGGLDERFQGWGYEDTEFLTRLANSDHRGRMHPSGLPLRELYVPSNRDLRGVNQELFTTISTERGW
jgi:hypothetical protein